MLRDAIVETFMHMTCVEYVCMNDCVYVDMCVCVYLSNCRRIVLSHSACEAVGEGHDCAPCPLHSNFVGQQNTKVRWSNYRRVVLFQPTLISLRSFGNCRDGTGFA